MLHTQRAGALGGGKQPIHRQQRQSGVPSPQGWLNPLNPSTFKQKAEEDGRGVEGVGVVGKVPEHILGTCNQAGRTLSSPHALNTPHHTPHSAACRPQPRIAAAGELTSKPSFTPIDSPETPPRHQPDTSTAGGCKAAACGADRSTRSSGAR
ncbi:hypothetical protein EYF80_002411 [Liparis tanakae]|uniref:Uncharacterized protein n=1 Tax=Liparis tanakae TaxID=230148 RepID=A0A4Z2JAG3_9TELE|nr:hypothetical protein EYF80_002411 [Liparis tanakae]